MRTPIVLDPDVEQLLRQAAYDSQQNFEHVLNDALRRGLAHLTTTVQSKPFVVKARPMSLRAGLDPTRVSDFGDDIETGAFVITTSKLNKVLGKI